jgi:ATP-dependent RNA helicase RhlE
MSFKNFPLQPALHKAIEALQFHEPAPVQRQAIPPAMEAKDILVSAQTGTGKTLAFLLPLLDRMLRHPIHDVAALVLLPTRELAAQVSSVARDLAKFTTVRHALLIGGESYGPQLEALRARAPLVIATPGRLLDHLERRTVILDHVHTLVLDEADRMLDMGFAPAIHAILRYLPTERHTMLFSATLPREIDRLSHLALKNPVRISLAPHGVPAEAISQMLYPVMPQQKNDLLLAILRNIPMQSVLIFCRTRHRADRLAHFLRAEDFNVVALHSDRTQGQRTAALHGFKTGRFQIMVATDIAARGLDVRRISHVINFDVPQHTEDYVHRIGRTGRYFEVGDALTLVAPEERPFMAAIERFIGRTLPVVMIPDFPYEKLPPPPKPKTFSEHFRTHRRSIPHGRFHRR